MDLTLFKTHLWRGRTAEQRFWEKVRRGSNDACWLWEGAKATSGGLASVPTKHGPTHISAHRLSWALANDADPGAGVVVRACGTLLCVNPAHLTLESRSDYATKGWVALRATQPTEG